MDRHIKSFCKVKNEKDQRDNEIQKKNDDREKIYEQLLHNQIEMQKQITALQQENNELKQKYESPAPKSVQNNTNNGVINNNCNVNNIYLVGYGKEDMSKIDRSDLLKGIKMGFNSTLKLIDTIHFNPKYPEFHNVYISSMKNKYAMMYDGADWTLVMKDELIDKMYDHKRNYIEENMDDFLDSLTRSQINALHRWLDAADDHPYIDKIKNDIKLLLYNKRKMVLNNKGREDMYHISNLDNIIVRDTTNIDKPNIDDTRLKVVKVPKDTKRKRKNAGRPGTKRKVTCR